MSSSIDACRAAPFFILRQRNDADNSMGHGGGAYSAVATATAHFKPGHTFVGWDWEMEGLLQAEMDIPCTMWVNDSCHHSNDTGVA